MTTGACYSDYDPPTFPNVFKLEMTPSKPVMNPDDPLTVTLKSMAKERLDVRVEVESYLFEIVDPRAMKWPRTQVYHILAPGETMSFKIGVTRETPKGSYGNRYVEKNKSPEGLLQISHKPTDQKGDTDKDWGFNVDEKCYNFDPEGTRFVSVFENTSGEHGYFEMEMSYVRETEVIKKNKEQFYAIKKQIEEDEKKKKEKDRLEAEKAEKKKKKKCCSIL